VVGALIGGGLSVVKQVGLQLADGKSFGESLRGIDLADVAVDAGTGALGISALKNAKQTIEALKKVKKLQKTRHLTNLLKEEAIEKARKEAFLSAGKLGAAVGLATSGLKDEVEFKPFEDDSPCE